jgi:predicted PurR-regulated permease PerM
LTDVPTCLHATLAGPLVTVSATDWGGWREPPTDPGSRGRGLILIHELCTRVEISATDACTTVMMRHAAFISSATRGSFVDCQLDRRLGPLWGQVSVRFGPESRGYTGSRSGAGQVPRSERADAMSTSSPDPAAGGHHDLVGQPHDAGKEQMVASAEAEAVEISDSDRPLGEIGKRFNRRSPFLIGMAASAGVAVTYGLVLVVVGMRDVLILIGLALFLAIGLEPLVSWLVGRGVRRWLAVIAVFLAALAALGGFLAAAIPVVVEQTSQLVTRAPDYLRQLHDHSSWLGQLNDRFHLEQLLQKSVNGGTALLGAGVAVFGVLANVLVVLVLTVYFVADLPRIRSALYRLVPHSRRPRAILIGDEISAKVGGYVLGNVVISVISGVLTLIWLMIFAVPYALLLAITVAVLDLVPVIGSIIGGVLVSLVALTVSFPLCLATVGFFVLYRLLEDYLLVPRIIGGVMKVPALVTVVAVLVGGALLGVIGALVSIPIAAALLLLAQEVLYPRLDRA